MDVASWLRSLGLEQYEAVLRENEVDESVLPTLRRIISASWAFRLVLASRY